MQVLWRNSIKPYVSADARRFITTWKRQLPKCHDSWSVKLWENISVKGTQNYLNGMY